MDAGHPEIEIGHTVVRQEKTLCQPKANVLVLKRKIGQRQAAGLLQSTAVFLLSTDPLGHVISKSARSLEVLFNYEYERDDRTFRSNSGDGVLPYMNMRC